MVSIVKTPKPEFTEGPGRLSHLPSLLRGLIAQTTSAKILNLLYRLSYPCVYGVLHTTAVGFCGGQQAILADRGLGGGAYPIWRQSRRFFRLGARPPTTTLWFRGPKGAPHQNQHLGRSPLFIHASGVTMPTTQAGQVPP
jgi:hypothetical protein